MGNDSTSKANLSEAVRSLVGTTREVTQHQVEEAIAPLLKRIEELERQVAELKNGSRQQNDK